ncbi:MAG: hypothetical protein RR595_06615 [Lysinibacillus sp.]
MLQQLMENGSTFNLVADQNEDLNQLELEIKQWIAQAVLYAESEFSKSKLLEDLYAAKGDFSKVDKEKVKTVFGIILAFEEAQKIRSANAQAIWDLNKN